MFDGARGNKARHCELWKGRKRALMGGFVPNANDSSSQTHNGLEAHPPNQWTSGMCSSALKIVGIDFIRNVGGGMIRTKFWPQGCLNFEWYATVSIWIDVRCRVGQPSNILKGVGG